MKLHARALLFDMDGTILTSIAAVERAWTAWAARVGVPAGPLLDWMHGRPARDIVARYAPEGADLAAEVAWLTELELADLDGVAPLPGAEALLRALPAGAWGVVTSATEDLARARIAAAGLPAPPVLVTSDMVARGKPDPEGFLAAAARLGVAPADCLGFEDAGAGLASLAAAGIRAVRLAGTEASDAACTATLRDYRGVGVAADPDGITLTLPA